MKPGPRLLTLLLVLAVASPAAASRFRKAKRQDAAKKVRRGKVKSPVRPGKARRGLPRRGFRRGVAKRIFRRSARPSPRAEGMANAYTPTRLGEVRTYSVKMPDGRKVTQSYEVTRVEVKGDTLRAQVEYRNSLGALTSHVTETRNGAVLPASVAKLGDKPPAGVYQKGEAFPKTLRVGKSWSYTSGSTEHTATTVAKVERSIVLKGPDGQRRRGFEISVVTTTRLTGQKDQVSHVGRYRVLKDVGMVWSQSGAPGEKPMTQTLIGYERGAR